MKTYKLFLLLLISACSSSPKIETTDQTKTETSATEHYIASPLQTAPPVTEKSGFLLSWPLRGVFDLTRGFIVGVRSHQGLDLAAPKGTQVRAAHAGYVEYAGRDFSGYGNLVIINSGSGWATFYAHLSKIQVREGQNVRRGDNVGKVGATGNARGVHLHFELRYKESPVDPMAYLP